MDLFLTLLALLLLAVVFGLALAHALEFPGKRRLDEATYRAVQAIYYPGFTVGGLVGELGGLIVLAIATWTAPPHTPAFGCSAVALALLIATHVVYWLLTHPVNGAWLRGAPLSGPARRFFGADAGAVQDWRQLRDLWEASHVIRALLAGTAFITFAIRCVIF